MRDKLNTRGEQEGACAFSFVGSHPAIKKVLDEADRAAQERHPTLIIGETGTGKELLARRIHAGAGPFVVIDCTHLTAELAERELFGHVRGAFTGATADSPGLIAAAHKGVAFLDEIGELPLSMQSKLLRVLQDKHFRRLGSVRDEYSDFRVIAATNRDLKEEARAGRFRLDLYQRLNVIKLSLPPLRERGDDITSMIAHLCQRWRVTFSNDAVGVLKTYSWPGNVRELENVVKRAAALAHGAEVGAADLPQTVYESRQQSTVQQALKCYARRDDASTTADAIECLADIETRAILQALKATNGNCKAAATRLKIGRTTLHRRIRCMLSEDRPGGAILKEILKRH